MFKYNILKNIFLNVDSHIVMTYCRILLKNILLLTLKHLTLISKLFCT